MSYPKSPFRETSLTVILFNFRSVDIRFCVNGCRYLVLLLQFQYNNQVKKLQYRTLDLFTLYSFCFQQLLLLQRYSSWISTVLMFLCCAAETSNSDQSLSDFYCWLEIFVLSLYILARTLVKLAGMFVIINSKFYIQYLSFIFKNKQSIQTPQLFANRHNM